MSAKEIWLTIKHNDNYEISNLGNVRNKKTKRILKPFTTSNNYLKVKLSKNNKQIDYFVHRLVAQAFIPNPNNYPEVNHKDENKLNNALSNLEFLTHKENIHYGTCMARKIESLKKTIENNKKLK